MKKYLVKFIPVVFVAALLLLSSCLKDNETNPVPIGGLLTINAYKNSPAVMFYTDGMALSPRGLKFKEVSGNYMSLHAGKQRLSVRELGSPESGQQLKLVDTSFEVKDSVLYSAFIFGNQKNPKLGIVEDHGTDALAENQAGIRFFNLAEEVGAVTLEINNKSGIEAWENREEDQPSSIGDFQSFNSFGEGVFDIQIKNKNGEVIAKRSEYSFKRNQYYSVILINDNADADASKRNDSTIENLDKEAESYYIGVVNH